MPDPWRGFASAALAPLTLAPSCCNNTDLGGCSCPAIAAQASSTSHGGGDGCGPGRAGCCCRVRLGFHHRRLDPAASVESFMSRCLQPADVADSSSNALHFYKFSFGAWLMNFQKMHLPCIAEADRSPDVRKLLDASVLQTSPAHDGKGWYCLSPCFFCSAPDVVCYSICGVYARTFGMDMLLDPLISSNRYAHNTLEIFELGHWTIAVAERSMHWDNLECLNRWNQVDQLVMSWMSISAHTQQSIYGSTADISIMASTIVSHERHFGCTCSSLPYDHHVQDAVSMLFGLCHRRWTTTPPSLIPRFNSGDTQCLSSAKVIRYLQLNPTPRVHFPDRPLGGPPTGHQLDCTYIEALEDCRCGNFESGLSTDDRSLYGSICDLQHLFHEFRSSSYYVQLGTNISCSTVESHVMMYLDP